MALKTTNFELKTNTGIVYDVLPEAVAVIRRILADPHGQGVATFGIHRTRELALNKDVPPLKEVKIYFTVDRNQNDRVTAYAKAKSSKMVEEYNEETKQIEQVEKKQFFYGWEDDILTE